MKQWCFKWNVFVIKWFYKINARENACVCVCVVFFFCKAKRKTDHINLCITWIYVLAQNECCMLYTQILCIQMCSIIFHLIIWSDYMGFFILLFAIKLLSLLGHNSEKPMSLAMLLFFMYQHWKSELHALNLAHNSIEKFSKISFKIRINQWSSRPEKKKTATTETCVWLLTAVSTVTPTW